MAQSCYVAEAGLKFLILGSARMIGVQCHTWFRSISMCL